MPRLAPKSDDAYKARLLTKCDVQKGGCWLYRGFIHKNGYGSIGYRNSNWRVHRLAFHLWNGPIPQGHDVCHTCDVRNCVNPEHLFSGPRQHNHDDMWKKGRAWQQKDHCRHGHPWSLYAYYVPAHTGKKGIKWRHCKRCDLIRSRVNAGWPRDLAETLPTTPKGRRPVNARGFRPRKRQAA